jgi:toxin CcdB
MAQFDVFRNPKSREYPFVVDVQSEVLSQLATRVVVPMTSKKRYGRPITRLNPTAKVRGVEYVLVFQEIAAVPTAVLRERVATLEARRGELVAAIELLFTGI